MLTTQCVVRTPSPSPFPASSLNPASSLSCGVLTIGEDRSTVYFPESDMSSISAFRFTSVSPARDQPGEVLPPLLPCLSHVGSGLSSATVVALGDPAETRALFEGQGPAPAPDSLIPAMAAHLLHALAEAGPELRTRLSVSWHSLHAGKAEGVVDMLKSASGAPSGSGRASEPAVDPSLIPAPLGPGLGAAVPGLWEIEVRSAQDVCDVLARVRGDAGSASPLFHSVFTFTAERIPVRNSTGKGDVRLEKAGLWPEPPAVTTLAVVALADLRNVGRLGSGWIEGLRAQLAGGAEGGYTSSRLGMHLADALEGRAPGHVVAVVDPALDKAPESLGVLRMAQEIAEAGERGEREREREREAADRAEAEAAEPLPPPPASPHAPLPPSSPAPAYPPQSASPYSSNAVPTTLLAALESKQLENQDLRSQVAALQQAAAEVQFEREELRARLRTEGGGLKDKDRARLRKALAEVKDYEVYKDVMEQTFHRMKTDIEELTKDRDKFAARCEKLEGFFRREKSEGQQKGKKIASLEQKVEMLDIERRAAEGEYGKLDKEFVAAGKAQRAQAKELARAKAELQGKDRELQAAKERISKMAVSHQRSRREAEKLSEAEGRVLGMKEWNGVGGEGAGRAGRAGGGGEGGKQHKQAHVNESLSRAQGSLNAAREIMNA